jgi:hypothetical protein
MISNARRMFKKSEEPRAIPQRVLGQLDPTVRVRNLSEAIEMMATHADKHPDQREAWAARADSALLIVLGLRGEQGRRLWLANAVEQVASLQLTRSPTNVQLDEAAAAVLVVFATAYPSLDLIEGIHPGSLRVALRARANANDSRAALARFWVAMCDLAARSGLGRVAPTSYAKEFSKYRQQVPSPPG